MLVNYLNRKVDPPTIFYGSNESIYGELKLEIEEK